MTRPNEQQLSTLSQVQWEDLFKRLLMFTHKRYGWLKDKYGWDLQDIVQQAIIDTLEGKRRWPPGDSRTADRRPNLNLFLFLCGVIRSNVFHQLEKERLRSHMDVSELEMLEPFLEESELSDNALPRMSEALFSNQDAESMALYHELSERIHSAVADDHDLTKVVDLLLNTPDYRPKEIAEQLGLPLPQVYRILKRLQKRLTTIQREAING